MTRSAYEVWNFAGSGEPVFSSDDAVEVVRWLVEIPVRERHYNVHPVGPMFIRGKLIAHDFISMHAEAYVQDIIEESFYDEKTEGLAKKIFDVIFER